MYKLIVKTDNYDLMDHVVAFILENPTKGNQLNFLLQAGRGKVKIQLPGTTLILQTDLDRKKTDSPDQKT